MALAHIVGIDHVMIVVRELDRAAEAWRQLGFTLSPRGTHSAQLGSANYTIVLDDDYLELLGILAPTPHNAPRRAFLDRRGEGLERVALTTTDAAAGVAEIRARGIDGEGPIDFGRPVDLPGGGETEARFRVFQWPAAEAPGGVGIFACQHLTRDAVWIPELRNHANTARRIDRIEILARDPRGAAEHMARLLDAKAVAEDDGAWRVATGEGRGAFVFLDRAIFAKRHRGVPADGLPDEGAAALVLIADDLDAAARAAESVALIDDGAVTVPPRAANGITLVFRTE